MRAETSSKASQWIDIALWAASLALLVLSFVLSWGPPPRFGPRFDWMDKVWHFLGYGSLCATLLLAAVWRPGRGGGRLPRAGLPVAAMVLVMGWLTEALQAPFGRDVQLLDAVADLAGVATGYGAWQLLILVASSRE